MALGSKKPLKEMSIRNIFLRGDKGGRCVGLTTLLPSCADCLEIGEPQSVGTLRACPDLYRDCFRFTMSDVTESDWQCGWVGDVRRDVCGYLQLVCTLNLRGAE